MPILTKLKEFLDKNSVSYKVMKHQEAFTAQEVAAAQHVPGMELAKVVILNSGKDCFMFVLPAPYRVDLKRAGALVGKRDVSLASEGQFAGLFPQCEPGAMPPFGNLYDIPVWVDEELSKDEEIVFNAGTHTQTVRMKYADFERLVKPTVVCLAEQD